MFKKNFIIKLAAIIIVAIIAALVFAGCKKSSDTVSANSRQGFNTSQMQQQEKTALAKLVSSGTITKSQSTAILNALESMMGNFGGRQEQEGGNQAAVHTRELRIGKPSKRGLRVGQPSGRRLYQRRLWSRRRI